MKNIKKKYLIIATLLIMSLLSVGIISYANNSTDVKQMMLNEAKGIFANPYKDALESLKIIKHNEKLAEKYNIVITDEEVVSYNKDQREMSEGSDAESKQWRKTLKRN